MISVIALVAFSVVALVLSIVAFTGVKDVGVKDEDKNKVKNAKNSATGLIVLSVLLVGFAGFVAWDVMKGGGSMMNKVIKASSPMEYSPLSPMSPF